MTRHPALMPLCVLLAFAGPAHAAEKAPQMFTIASELQPQRPLRPGEFTWAPEERQDGELVVVVDLKTQLMHVYRDGHEIGLSTVSTGMRGFETPTGVFPILEKNLDHYSDLYDLSPMPYMQRLTWDGIALHGGKVPAYRASHGCVRMPEAFARILFHETVKGGTVIVAPDWAGTTSTYAVAYDPDPAAVRLGAAGK